VQYARIIVPTLALLVSACVQPPQYTDAATSAVGVRADSKFADVTLAVVPTDNAEKSRHYIAQVEGMMMGFPTLTVAEFNRGINGLFSSRFGRVLEVRGEDEARTRNADMIMALDSKVTVGQVSFTSTTVELSGVFKSLDGTEIKRVSGRAEKMIPYPNFTNQSQATFNEAMGAFAKAIDEADDLAQEAQRLAQTRKANQAVAASAAPAAAPASKFPTVPLAVRFAASRERPDDVAVIIGNADYSKQGRDIPDVKPAYADAEGARRYARDALGIRDGNIIYLKDATGAQLTRVFGSDKDHRGQLFDWVKAGRSRVFVYYAGHGAPASQGGTAFLVPTDADAARIELNGYSLKTLYDNLNRLPAESVTLVLEACFSGASQAGSVIAKASPVFTRVEAPVVPQKVTLVAAGAADQIASWEQDTSHSLFTKFFLLGQSGEADKSPHGNGDGRVSLDELDRYLKETLTYYARRYYGRDQTAQIVSGGRAP